MGLFKAYDVRGLVPENFNPQVAFQIGYGFAKVIAEDEPEGTTPVIVVGMDARPSSAEIAAAFMDGLKAGGATPKFAGPCSTPMLYWVVGSDSTHRGGAMITASHNPARYNGIKFCREEAIPIAMNTGLADIRELSKQAPEPPEKWESQPVIELTPVPPESDPPAPFGVVPTHFAGYVEHLRRFVKRMPEGLKVAVDPSNGMGGIYLGFLRSLGLKLVTINAELDGTFPNHEANPSRLDNLKPLCDLVKRRKCDLGIAFDGDADRAVFIDETGTPIGQDMITALLAGELLKRHKGAPVLYDLRSSRAVPETIEAAGGRAVRERVGHSFMKATMRKVGCIFGGELAGHYYFKDNFYADSGILVVIEVLNALGLGRGKLSELVKPLRKYAQTGEVNFRVEDTDNVFKQVESAFKDAEIDHLDGVTVQYPEWWFNLRASNTEPLVRLNLEAASAELMREKFKQVSDMIGTPDE
jgi:phosphomannomutase